MPDVSPLRALYDNVFPLTAWASQYLELDTRIRDWDENVYICWNGDILPSADEFSGKTMQHVIEAAHRANVISMRKAQDGWKRRNVFSTGCNLRGGQLVMDQPNSTTAAVSQSHDWKRVHDIIGPALLFQLFTEYSVFYALENSCFHQLSGTGAQNVPARPTQTKTRKSPADIRFDRGPICYRQRRNAMHFGWPADHPLQPNSPDSLEARAAQLLRKMFPRAHGDTSAFDSQNVTLVPRKPPKLLRKTVLSLVVEMLQRSSATPIAKSLLRHCPSRLPSRPFDSDDQEAIVHLLTQEPYAMRATEGATQAAARFFPHQNDVKKKEHQPCFLDFACPHYKVVRFLREVLSDVVPRGLFGSDANFSHVIRFVDYLIQAKRLDVVSLQTLSDGFRLKDCLWLCPIGKDGKEIRLAQAEAIERTMLMQDFLYWLVDGLIMPLLRFNFFITESSATRNQLHYFRCDDWTAMSDPVIEKLKTQQYERIEVPAAKQLATSVVRLLPKDRGMRPVANLGYRRPIPQTTRKEPSVNDKLAESRVILSYEQKKRPEILGSSIYTPNDVMKPLLRLKERLGLMLGKEPLYFVKIDVRACFDTIRQDRLLAVLAELIDPDATYVLAKRSELTLRHGHIFRQYNRQSVLDQDEEILFTDSVLDLASTGRRKVFVDGGGTTTLTAQSLFERLQTFLQGTYVRFGEEVYRQKEGIPQGSSISGILCSLFYAHLDKHVLSSVTQSPDNLLVRLLDDFLFISPREIDAERFLITMLQKAAPYGAEVAREKSVVNFELPNRDIYDGIAQVPLASEFAWCGFVLDQNLDVRVDYGRQRKTHMRDTFSVSSGRNPGRYFLARFYNMARSMMFRVAFDADLNSLHSVRISIYQAFLILAMRMYAYSTAHLSAKRGIFLLQRHRLLVQGAERLIASSKGGFRLPPTVEAEHALYLGMCAFERVWSRKGREGQKLTAELKKVVDLGFSRKRFWYTRSRYVLAHPSNELLDKLRF